MEDEKEIKIAAIRERAYQIVEEMVDSGLIASTNWVKEKYRHERENGGVEDGWDPRDVEVSNEDLERHLLLMVAPPSRDSLVEYLRHRAEIMQEVTDEHVIDGKNHYVWARLFNGYELHLGFSSAESFDDLNMMKAKALLACADTILGRLADLAKLAEQVHRFDPNKLPEKVEAPVRASFEDDDIPF